MDKTIAAIKGALSGVDPSGGLSDKDKEIIGIIDVKLREVEDYFDRPLDAPEIYERLANCLEMF